MRAVPLVNMLPQEHPLAQTVMLGSMRETQEVHLAQTVLLVTSRSLQQVSVQAAPPEVINQIPALLLASHAPVDHSVQQMASVQLQAFVQLENIPSLREQLAAVVWLAITQRPQGPALALVASVVIIRGLLARRAARAV